jgi:hypothetical protein
MIEWCIIFYFLLSFFVMNVVQPQRDTEHPVFNTILCFFIGGLVFITAAVWGISKMLKGKK